MLDKFVLRSPARYWSIAALARLLRVTAWITRGLRLSMATAVLIIVIQLLYPHQIARPFTRLNSQAVSFWSTNRLARLAATSGQKPYTLTVANHSYQESPSHLGVTSNDQKTVAQVLHYSLLQRLIPLSILAHGNYAISKQVNHASLQSGLQQFAAARAQDPVDASVTQANGVYTSVQPGKLGYVVNTKRLQTEVLQAPFAATVQVPQTALPPAITQSMEQAVLADWRAQTNRPVIVHIGAQTVAVPITTVRTWADISTNQKQDKVFVTYDEVAVKAWLNAYIATVAVAPKPAIRHIQDDVVVSTTDGSNGAAMDGTSSTASIINALRTPERTAAIQTTPLAFTTQEVRNYSATSQGLQTLINDWSVQYKGMTAGVSFQELGGQSRSASLHDTQPFFAASIYKLFITLYVDKQLESNTLSPSLAVANNATINSCLEAMIVVSDNDCPHEIANQLGWANIDNFTKQQGFGATTIVDGNSSTDTADTAKFLQELYGGSLLHADHSAALLDRMRRQIYRSAIPAGSVGSTVADKVGFYGSYWHDAAIVQSPKATYVLVVFTSSAGPPAIKDLAAQIQQTLNQ